MQLLVSLLIVSADLSIEADGRALVLDHGVARQFCGEILVNPPTRCALAAFVVTEGTEIKRLIEPTFPQAACQIGDSDISCVGHALDRTCNHEIIEGKVICQRRTVRPEETYQRMS